MIQWLLGYFSSLRQCSSLLQEVFSLSFLFVYCNQSSPFPGFHQSPSVWPPICCLWTCVCMCVRVLDVCFLLCYSLITCASTSCFVPVHFPLLSVHPFLFWWQPAWSRSVSTGTQMNSDLPVCLFISHVFRVQRVGAQTGIYWEWQLGVNQICRKQTLTEIDLARTWTPNVSCYYTSKTENIYSTSSKMFLSYISKYYDINIINILCNYRVLCDVLQKYYFSYCWHSVIEPKHRFDGYQDSNTGYKWLFGWLRSLRNWTQRTDRDVFHIGLDFLLLGEPT